MFAELVAGLRHVKYPLTAGYAALLTLWILFADSIPTVDEASSSGDQVEARIGRLLGDLGPAAIISLVTFGALMIGAVIVALLAHPVDRTIRFFDKWGQLGLTAARGRELIDREALSAHDVVRVEQGLDDLRRYREEVEYRILLAFASFGPAIASLSVDLTYGWTIAIPVAMIASGAYIARTAEFQAAQAVTFLHARAVLKRLDRALQDAGGDFGSVRAPLHQILKRRDLRRIRNIDDLAELADELPRNEYDAAPRDQAESSLLRERADAEIYLAAADLGLTASDLML